MLTAPVIKIIDSSVVDGPGNRAAVFLQGCNFNCKYCHNPETIDLAGQPDTLQFLTVKQVVDRVGSSLPFIRGLTISGGECMLHEAFVYEVCLEVKRRYGQDFSCLLDSNGSIPYDKVLPVIDGVLLDVKAVDESAHRMLTGAPAAPVMVQAAALAKEGKLTEIRTVVLGNYDGSEDCILRTAKTITGASGPEALHKISYKLIKYRPRGARKEYLKELKIPADKEMERLARIAADCGFSPVVIV